MPSSINKLSSNAIYATYVDAASIQFITRVILNGKISTTCNSFISTLDRRACPIPSESNVEL